MRFRIALVTLSVLAYGEVRSAIDQPLLIIPWALVVLFILFAPVKALEDP